MELGPGTRVVVTGASRGIGRALAEAFAARGCTLGLVARSHDELAALAAELPGEGHEPLEADVGERDSIAAALERFGVADVVVANAGVAHYGRFLDQPIEHAERMTRINWLGTVYTVHAALGAMVLRGRGHLVLVSSGAGLRSFPEAAVYGATKAAMRGFGEALRHELAGTGVSLTMVYPGEYRSHLHDHEQSSMPDWYRGGERAGDPGELAGQVVAAVEADARAVYAPPLVRVLRIAHGLSPRLGDRILRRLRGPSAAARLD